MNGKRFCVGAGILIAIMAVWLFGFSVFCNEVFDYLVEGRPAISPSAEHSGIAVLTGGRNRIAKAVTLLNKNYGERLLISGVTPGVTLEMILDREDVHLHSSRPIDLGYDAQDTVGNAKEVSEWVKLYGYTRLWTVTSFYHIPRSRLELKRYLPETEIIFAAADTPVVLPQWWKSFKSFCFLAAEYSKFLVVWIQYNLLGL